MREDSVPSLPMRRPSWERSGTGHLAHPVLTTRCRLAVQDKVDNSDSRTQELVQGGSSVWPGSRLLFILAELPDDQPDCLARAQNPGLIWKHTSSDAPRVQLCRGCRVGLPQRGLSPGPQGPSAQPYNWQCSFLQDSAPPITPPTWSPVCSQHTLHVHR